MNWFDQTDVITPYKAIGEVKCIKNDKKSTMMETVRFVTKDEALEYFHNCEGRCIVSHHDYKKETTTIIAYKFR